MTEPAMPPVPLHHNLQAALDRHGLSLRGAFAPTPADGLPMLPNGQPAAGVWMVGVIGSAFWPHFKASPFFSDGLNDPLDRWSRAIGEELAHRLGGLALFPFDGPPYWPFQRWADRSEATEPSRMLLRIHPHYGLWHAYRFALALPAPWPGAASVSAAASTAPAAQPSGTPPLALGDICSRCSGQPCLQACPVQAYGAAGFALERCATHLRTAAGADCMQAGCRARNACPEGAGQRYSPEHAAFHMQAFLRQH